MTCYSTKVCKRVRHSLVIMLTHTHTHNYFYIVAHNVPFMSIICVWLPFSPLFMILLCQLLNPITYLITFLQSFQIPFFVSFSLFLLYCPFVFPSNSCMSFHHISLPLSLSLYGIHIFFSVVIAEKQLQVESLWVLSLFPWGSFESFLWNLCRKISLY